MTAREPDAQLNGVLAVDKPEGPTSHDVVAAARRALRTRRIGHTGTLDPFASGLLLLCIGSATRLAELLTGFAKSYEAEAVLGVETDTDDLTGQPVATSDAWRELDESDIREAFEAMTGPLLQTPPAYSAKKTGGKRHYAMARRGESVEAAAVPVTIHELRVTAVDPPRVRFTVDCSSGTYIRAIARDAGRTLGVGGHLGALRRTRIGSHDVSRAMTLDALAGGAEIPPAAWLTPLEAVGGLPRVEVDEAGATDIGHGRAIVAPEGMHDAPLVAIARGDTLLALGRAEHGRVLPRKVFA